VITMTSLEAQNRFGEMMDTSQREPVVITRRGRNAAIVVSANAEPRALQYQFTKLMSELFPLRGAGGAAELTRALAPVRASAAKRKLTEEKLNALLNEK
jgi:prevent-host-death family protein